MWGYETFMLAYVPQDATILSKGAPFMGEEVEVTRSLRLTKEPKEKTTLAVEIKTKFESRPAKESVKSP